MIALSSLPAFAGEKYPLAMSVVYTKGKSESSLAKDATYQSGDFYCTRGTENSAPVCHTVMEWAELDAVGGTPDTAVFTLSDGTTVKVQSNSVTKLSGYVICFPGSAIIFCSLYYDLIGIALPPMSRTVVVSGYKQTIPLTAEEMDPANKKLFGNGNSFTVTIPYKLKGKVDKRGFQPIEVDVDSLPPDNNSPRSKGPLRGGYLVEPSVR
jgi:hypothetical protein